MKIRMLGTGYGECKIKKKTVKDFRRRGGVIVDEKILIDAPGDIFDVALDLGFSDMFDGIFDVVISHSHPAHFSPETIIELSKNKVIRVYATGKVLDLIPDTPNIEKIKLSISSPVMIEDYTLYSLPSNHETDIRGEVCLNFLIVRDKALFYALDGGLINFTAWKVLSQIKPDAVILDCALELKSTSSASVFHNGIEGAKVVKDIIFSISDTQNAKIVLSHIPSDRKRSVHDELSECAREYGMSVAYDGYFFSI